MAGDVTNRDLSRIGECPYLVVLEHEPTQDAEDRLLRVYEFLLYDLATSETCAEPRERT